MSVTFTCKRVAAAFRSGDDIIYALGEVTYESNVYPHTRHLSTTFVGKLQEAIKMIFSIASDTCGGALNSPDRKMTPERYVKSGLNALKKPYLLDPNMPIKIRASAWDKKVQEEIMNVILGRGTEPTLGNHYDIPRINRYIDLPFSEDGRPYGEPCEALGYAPQKVSGLPEEDFGRIFKLPASCEHYYARLDKEGNLVSRPEWEYRIMGDYVSSIWETEITHPGSYKQLIPDFREHLRTLPVTDHLICTLDPSAKYCSVEKTIEKYGSGEFLLSDVAKEDLCYVYGGLKSIKEA
jgi:hypothetical protein